MTFYSKCKKNVKPCLRFDLYRFSQHSFVAIDLEIFSVVILSLSLIQEVQLSVSGERWRTNTG